MSEKGYYTACLHLEFGYDSTHNGINRIKLTENKLVLQLEYLFSL